MSIIAKLEIMYLSFHANTFAFAHLLIAIFFAKVLALCAFSPVLIFMTINIIGLAYELYQYLKEKKGYQFLLKSSKISNTRYESVISAAKLDGIQDIFMNTTGIIIGIW